MPKILTLEEVKKKFTNRNLMPLFDEYISYKDKLIAQTQEGYKVYINLDSLKQNNKTFSIFGKRNPYIIENIKLWCELNNKPFTIINSQEFKGNNKKLNWKCLKDKCGEIFEAKWSNIQQGNGCGYCAGRQVCMSNCLATKNPELAKEWHPIKNGDLTPYNVTCGTNKKVWWLCSEEHEWQTMISGRNKGNNCPYCSGRYPTKENNLLIYNPELCKEWDYNKNEKLPEEYLPNSSKKVWWICSECGYEWYAKITHRNNNSGCPQCNKSKGEKEIKKWLDNHNILYEPQKDFDSLLGLGGGKLSYDFYLPNYNLFIEYQGEFHNGGGNQYTKLNLKYQQEHDKRKREYAQLNNIKLLEIWYWDFDNIEEILNKSLYQIELPMRG